jgi:hypothetical protein
MVAVDAEPVVGLTPVAVTMGTYVIIPPVVLHGGVMVRAGVVPIQFIIIAVVAVTVTGKFEVVPAGRAGVEFEIATVAC